MATYEGLVKLGTLRLGSTIKPRPTLPWQIQSAPYSGAGIGNIADFNELASIDSWKIGDTDVNDSNKLQWHKIKDGTKTLLICDRVILVNVSWNDLHSDNRVFGKTITIDGQPYVLRLLKGGSNFRSGSDAYSGGAPASNEWDRFITNEDAIVGIPTPSPSDLNDTLDNTDKNGATNQFWNWMGIFSWAQETYTGNSATRAYRGYRTPRYWVATASAGSRNPNIGWRPVLEMLNQPPTISLTSPTDNQTLSEGSNYPIEGSANDPDVGDIVSIWCKVNNAAKRAIGSGVSDGTSPISFAKNLRFSNRRLWDGSTDVIGYDLAENTDHTLTVWAEDDKGGKSAEVTRKFRVVWNRPPVIDGQDEDLGTTEVSPSKTYAVTDPEGDSFTITEKVNSTVIRSFPGVTGRQETITIPLNIWLQLEPGIQHVLQIEAVDSNGMRSVRTYTFTRFENQCEFEIEEPWETDVAAKRILFTPDMILPPGAILTAEACNNGFDAVPTWEDISFHAQFGRGYVFNNTQKTAAKWGVNIRMKVEKGTATEPVIIKGFGGAFD